MWSKLPIIGWLLALILNFFLTILAYFLWNYVAPKYLYNLPSTYQNIPFWDILWIVLLISIVKHIFLGGIFNKKIEKES